MSKSSALEPFVSTLAPGSEGSHMSVTVTRETRGVTRLLVFLALCVAAMVLTNYVVDSGLRRLKTSSFGVFNRIVDGQINATIVISGSSRALNHYDPRVIRTVTGRTAYNIGINGSQTDMQVAVLKTYLNHNEKPSLVVHNLDSFAFVTSRGGIWFPGQYLPYLHEEPIYEALSSVDRDAWKWKYLPLYGYAVEDMSFTWLTGMRAVFGWNPREDRYFGFQPRDARWTDDFAHFVNSKRDGIQFSIEPEGLRDFEDLIALCKQRQIPVVLVYSPVYYEMQELEMNRDQIFRHFNEIAQRYDAPIWDYSGSPISRRRDYFVNSQHLNAAGAAAFSADFSADLTRSGLFEARTSPRRAVGQ